MKTLKKGRVTIEFLDDQYTPVMVELKVGSKTYNGTYECVIDNGEVEEHNLTQSEIDWLISHEEKCNEWYDQHRDVNA